MMIQKIYSSNTINPLQNSKPVSGTSSVKHSADEIIISDEAKEMQEAEKLDAIARETPDVREDLVEQVKQKIKDPNYLNNAIASAADQFLRAYGL
ncbi:MAG: flagellar biosynthesis anti-sigma factor FlgM [Treponema sp.]|nr:flagellar biosynthesis anti-sigma factor FlgM [Treponema sp.]